MIIHENRLPTDDSTEITCLLVIFEKKKQQNLKLSSAAKCRWRFKGYQSAPWEIFHVFCRMLIYFKINFFEKLFQKYHQSVN